MNDNIQQLLIEKATGTISATDEAYINKLIEENAEVNNKWNEINNFYHTKGRQYIDVINEDVAWNKIKNKISNQQPGSFRLKNISVFIAAASIILLISTIFLFTDKQRKNIHQPVASAGEIQEPKNKIDNTSSNQIQLTLASGESINLSDSLSKTITTTSANINATQHALSFNTNNNNAIEWNTLQVPTQLDYKITLADGTVVWLNSISQLRFPFSFAGNKREIYVSGEAFLKVAKNASKPFIVHTDEADIVVHGTVFNVNTYTQNKTVVSLVEGAVTAFKKNNDSLQLKPGFEAAIFQNNKSSIQSFDENNVTAWMTGMQYFHEASLNDIAQIIYRWFNTKVIFDDSHVAGYTFTGVINKNKPLADFLNNLKASSEITFNYSNGDLHIR